MIRFCDKEVYVRQDTVFDKRELFQFFLDGHRHDIIGVYDETQCLVGTVSYDRFLRCGAEDCINFERISITDQFWEEAHMYFDENPKELLPVVGDQGELLGFCYEDRNAYESMETILKDWEAEAEAIKPVHERYPGVKQICITDLNELAWLCYYGFQKEGYAVCVIGEKWEWFGIKSCVGYLDYPDYEKLYIYAEGTEHTRKEREYELSLFPPVFENFKFLKEFDKKELGELFKKRVLELQELGVPVCVCTMPKLESIQTLTELEKKSIEINADQIIFERFYRKEYGIPTEEQKEILKRIKGEETYFALQTGELLERREKKVIPLGEIKGGAASAIAHTKRIFVFGPCLVWGEYDLHRDSFVHCLQQMVEMDGYTVITVLIPLNYNAYSVLDQISDMPIRAGDIFIFFEEDRQMVYGELEVSKRIDLKRIYETPERQTWFCVAPYHANKEGICAITTEIYEKFLKEKVQSRRESIPGGGYIRVGELLNREERDKVKQFVETVRAWERKAGQKVGAIVMNCNPFTYGHKYLIEYAARKMDYLYIFVVEEDRSYFKFEDRIELVRQGTREHQNVKVVPSGKWVLSWQTLPLYFEKAERKEEEVDAQIDLEIFARYVAPGLGITYRFVGEEPTDPVTRQYNEQMHEILGEFGIEVVEIPRKEREGRAISASFVRECMRENEWDKLEGYLPPESYAACLNYKAERCIAERKPR